MVNASTVVFGIIGGIALIGSWAAWGIRRARIRSNQKPAIEFDIKEQHVGLEHGGITFARQESTLEEEFIIEFLARVFVSNPGPATSVAFFVAAIDPGCLKDGVSPKDIKVTVQHQLDPYHSPTPQDNPYYLKSDEMNSSTQLRVTVPFSVPKIESRFGSLSSLRSVTVTFGAEQTGRKPILRAKSCDLTKIHHDIEEQVATKVQHIQSQQLSAKQVLQVLKRYWRGPQ